MGSPQSPLDFVGRGKIYAVFVILLLAKEFEHGMYLDESPVSRTKTEKSEPNFPNRKRVRIFCLFLKYYIQLQLCNQTITELFQSRYVNAYFALNSMFCFYTKSIGNKRKGTVFSSKCIRTTSIYRMQFFNYYLTNFSVYCYAYY